MAGASVRVAARATVASAPRIFMGGVVARTHFVPWVRVDHVKSPTFGAVDPICLIFGPVIRFELIVHGRWLSYVGARSASAGISLLLEWRRRTIALNVPEAEAVEANSFGALAYWRFVADCELKDLAHFQFGGCHLPEVVDCLHREEVVAYPLTQELVKSVFERGGLRTWVSHQCMQVELLPINPG